MALEIMHVRYGDEVFQLSKIIDDELISYWNEKFIQSFFKRYQKYFHFLKGENSKYKTLIHFFIMFQIQFSVL